MQTKLRDDELYQLESIVEDGIAYLDLPVGKGKRRIFRMLFPTPAQRKAARLEQHRQVAILYQTGGLQTARQIEKERKEDLLELRQQIKKLRKEYEKQQKEIVKRLFPQLPDKDDTNKAELSDMIEGDEGVQRLEEIEEETALLTGQVRDILRMSVEELALDRYMEILTQTCWYESGEGDEWVLIWGTMDEYDNDSNKLTQMLVNQTRLWLLNASSFFVNSRVSINGENDT